MAKIDVQPNCPNLNMKKQGSLRAQRTLSKQSEFDEEPLIETSSLDNSLKQNESKNSIDGAEQEIKHNNGGLIQRSRTHSKVKLLVRSQAIREATSPPRDPLGCSVSPTPMYHSTTPDLAPTNYSNNVSPVNTTPDSTITSNLGNIQNSDTNMTIYSSEITSTMMQQNSSVSFESNDDSGFENGCENQSRSNYGTNSISSSRLQCIPMEINIEAAPQIDENSDEDEIIKKCETKNCQHQKMNSSPNNANCTSNNHTKNNIANMKNSANRQKYSDMNNITVSCQSRCDQDCKNCSANNCLSKNIERTINNNIASSNNNNHNVPSNNMLTVNRANTRNKLKHQNSSQGSFDSSSASPCLSRDSSTEQYTDTTGVNLTQFILETLNKNAKDRMLMLKIEQELVMLAKDKSKNHFRFPPMSSYQRMLVHRCAAYFGMDHNIESSGKCVIVNKTKGTRIPDIKFRDHIRDDYLFPEEPRRSILKRDSNSFEDCSFKSPDRQLSMENRRSKSFEEREEEYEKVRRRIFNREDCSSQEELGWTEIPWSSSDSENSSRMRLLPPEHNIRPNRLFKGQSVETKDTLRPCVSKSFSFGGYTGATVSLLSRGDSMTSTHSAGARLLTKQDSSTSTTSWRLSPSSSGYKSQSQRSDSVTPSPTATPYPASVSGQQSNNISTDESPSAPHQTMNWQEPPMHNHTGHSNQIGDSSQTTCPPPPPPPPSQHSVMWTTYHPHQIYPSVPNEKSVNQGHVMWPVRGTSMVPQAQYSNNHAQQHDNQNRSMLSQTHRDQASFETASPPVQQQAESEEQINNQRPPVPSQQTVMWAVTDLQSVPKGSVLINPQTGQPFTNQDGSIYHFDPSRPPPSLGINSSLSNVNNVKPSSPTLQVPQQTTNIINQQTHNCTYKSNTSSMTEKNHSANNTTKQSSSPPPVKNQKHEQPLNGTVSKSYTPPPANIKQTQPVLNKCMNSNNNNVNKHNYVQAKQNSPSKQISTESGTQSPKRIISKSQKSTSSKNPNIKSGFTNSATSPSLPFSPPVIPSHFGTVPSNQHIAGYQYLSGNQMENVNNLPMQSYAVTTYPNHGLYGTPNMVPIQDAGTVPMYASGQPQMMYGYGVPVSQQFERMDNSITDMTGYFVNMNIGSEISGSSGNTGQTMGYQNPTLYWGQQPMVCYIPPPTTAQPNPRYTVPVMQGQTGTYMPAYAAPAAAGPVANYQPVLSTAAAQTAPSGTELVPMYPTAPAPTTLMYGPAPPVPANGAPISHSSGQFIYATASQPPANTVVCGQNPSTQMYAPMQNIIYPNGHNTPGAYPVANTPGSNFSTPSSVQFYSDKSNYNGQQNTSNNRNIAQKPVNGKNNSRNTPSTQSQTNSNQGSSVSSNSPASTVVHTFYQTSPGMSCNGGAFNTNKHCSPSDTPNPPMGVGPSPYGFTPYPQGYGHPPPIPPPQSAFVYRSNLQMNVRASPPVNTRTSRSPTPNIDHYDRNNRYSLPPTLYQTVSCLVPGDVRYVPPRQQTPQRNTYGRPPSFTQANNENTLGRPPKVKKSSKTKSTPPLPPSGR